ncbi:hypothetical protein FEM48_Zijuj11G0146100 [Ziziphus jujuba var. spinosa]|uniref:Pentatricopeptide repeat-containing protein At2g01390 n=1 Tax=Ziziphus jujuba var. spinosa TaxID=714518 RepID=A0A978UJI3_ZIZJJ|nr:hypothetical protein FEM48_Zijuj11G0146100 [Ziziphus jujuba var. spinosa]
MAKNSLFLWFSRNSQKILVSPATFSNSLVKNSIKFVHSFDHFKQNKSIKPFLGRKSRKYPKTIAKEAVDPKVYMRDTIGKIYKILRYSTWDSAQDQLQGLPVRWDSYTVNQILKTHPPMEKAWLFFNWADRLKGFKHDQFTYTTMIDIFGEAGRISSMNFVFKQMQEREIEIDAVTYTSLMHWIYSSGDVDGAMEVWEQMKANGCKPTVVSYTAYMKILFNSNRVEKAIDAYKEMLQSGCSPNCHTYTVLMEYLIGSGKCKEALEIFDKMQEAGVQPDKAACNILIKKLCESGATWAMTQILQYMKENHIVLRYPVFLEACEILKVSGESDSLLRQVNPHFSNEPGSTDGDFGKTPAAASFTLDEGLILILLRKENLAAVNCLLAEIINKNIKLNSAIISTIIKVNCDHCRLHDALLAFEYSVKIGLIIERNSYLALVGALVRAKSFTKVMDVVEEMIRAGHSLGIYAATILIYRLGCARRPIFAMRIFNLFPDDHKCTATYTALIGAYFSAGAVDKGLKIFETMKGKGILPSLGTYNVLLSGLSKSGRVNEVEIFRKEKKKLQIDGHPHDIVPVDKKICDLLFVGDGISIDYCVQ